MTSRQWSACQRKRAYPTELAAAKAIQRMRAIYGVDIGTPYLCEYDDHWHTGHQYAGDKYLATKEESRIGV